MRHAGLGWPDGPDPGTLDKLPGSAFLLLDSEARWHWSSLRGARPDALLVWRSIAKPPATLGYDAAGYADLVLRHWSDQPHQVGDHLIPANELNLNYERGDDRDDLDYTWQSRVYPEQAKFLATLRPILRARVPNATLHFPGWAPGHYLRELRAAWIEEARQWSVIDVHAYGTTEEIDDELDWYRFTFPGKKLFLSEWHGRVRDDVPSERRTLERLAERVRDDDLFLGATYFIWRWWSGQTDDWNIEGNPEREQLFRDPPVAGSREAAAAPDPGQQVAAVRMSQAELVDLIGSAADAASITREILLGLCIAESDLDPDARRPINAGADEQFWPDVSFGLCQQTIRWSAEYLSWSAEHGHPPGELPGEDVISFIGAMYCDPKHALEVAIPQLTHYLTRVLQGAA